MKKIAAFLLAASCLLAAACTARDTNSFMTAESTVSSNAEISTPEESSNPQPKFKIGSDEGGIEKAKEVAGDYYKNTIGSEKLGWKIKKYNYDPVYGSEFESIWLQMIGIKASVYPDWTFYAFDVDLNENERHMIVIGKSPENKWEVVNYGH